MTHKNPDPEETEKRRIVDMRVPLPWLVTGLTSLIISAVSFAWNLNRQNDLQMVKLDQIAVAVQKLEKQFEMGTARVDSIQRDLYTVQRVDDSQSKDIASNERRINHLESILKVRP